MALVEAVAGELVDQLENVFGVRLLDLVAHGALDEAGLLLRHLALVFFAHGAAQQVGFTQREARHHLGDLHHLFLVDDDAVSLLEDRLQHRVEAVEGLLPVLAVDVGRNVVHRAGAVERHHGDDVLETVGFEPLEALAHARAFELEHTDRIGLRQHLIALAVVERELGKVDVDAAAALDELDGLLQHCQCLEAEEVSSAGPIGKSTTATPPWRTLQRARMDAHALRECGILRAAHCDNSASSKSYLRLGGTCPTSPRRG